MNWRIETKENYYNTLVEWWTEWNFPILPLEMIPDEIYVVADENTDLYAIPVYVTNSSICWIGFPTGNKKAPRKLKKGALEYILEVIEKDQYAKGTGMILTTSATPKIMRAFDSRDYIKSDKGTNFYTKILWEQD